MPISRAKLFEHRPAELEVILPEPEHCFRWFEHDYPYDLARWNHHPEFEVHLIRQGSGKLVAGDYIGAFSAGHVALIGPDLPHDWIGELAPGEYLSGRDVAGPRRIPERPRRGAAIRRCGPARPAQDPAGTR